MFTRIPEPEWIESLIHFRDVVERIKKHKKQFKRPRISLDTETTGLMIAKDYSLIVSFSTGENRYGFMTSDYIREPEMVEILGDESVDIVGTNIKFDFHMLENLGIPKILGAPIDTMVMSWLKDENSSLGLKENALALGIKMMEFKEAFPKLGTKKGIDNSIRARIEAVMGNPEKRSIGIDYSTLDAYGSLKLFDSLEKDLHEIPCNNRTMLEYFYDVEVPFTKVLYDMERDGIMVNVGYLKDLILPINKLIQSAQLELEGLIGRPINTNSPKQLQAFFYDELKRKVTKWTKGGVSGNKSPSVDEEVLVKWVNEGCPYSTKIMDANELKKLLSTYVKGPIDWVDDNLRIHATTKQTGTVTGRISYEDPSLQVIPRKPRFNIREAFIAAPGNILLDFDYDQLEMKIMAHMAKDTNMIDAINKGMDLHCYTVSMVYGIPYEECIGAKKAEKTKDKIPLTERQEHLMDLRTILKAVGFGIIYGIGPFKLGKQIGKNAKEAKNYIDMYFGLFDGVKKYIEYTHEMCHALGYVNTLAGRYRRLPEINAYVGTEENNKGIVLGAERQACNSTIQGTAADIAKSAMIRIKRDPLIRDTNTRLLVQIHDELILETPNNNNVPKVMERVRFLMEHPFNDEQPLSVPLSTGGNMGMSWSEAK